MDSLKFSFPGADGDALAARLEVPDGEPVAYAVFAHCFTCGKNSSAAVRIARALAGQGVAVLRFDFTGLGQSGGDFAGTTVSSNIADLVAAAASLRATRAAPRLLIGHSLGGAAVIAAAHHIPEVRAVVTIGAPSEVGHVARQFGDRADAIRADGVAEVSLAGRAFTLRRAFLDDLARHDQTDRVARLRRALLVMHAPTDAVVGIENATHIFTAARHPKSFVSLDGADHLLNRPGDAVFAAGIIAAWSQRYIRED